MDTPALLDTKGPAQKSSRFPLPGRIIIVLLLVAAVGASTWYSLQSSCEVDAVREASALLVRQRNSYDHTYQFATSASRTSLVHPVTALQQILMDTQDVPVPACMQTAKNELIHYMGAVIRAFQAFGAQEADAVIRDLLDQSDRHYDNFSTELEAVNKCAPLCLP